MNSAHKHPSPKPDLRAAPGRRAGYILLAASLALVGAVCGMHHALLFARHGADYTPFSPASMLTRDEAAFYAPMVAEKLRGRWTSANPHFAEGKGRPTMPAWVVPVWTLALLGLATGLRAPELFVLADVVFPMLCAYGFYRLLRALGSGRVWAAWSGGALILANDFLTRGQFGLRYFDPPPPEAGGHPLDPLFFTRTFSPSVVLPFMLLFVLLLIRMVRKRTAPSAVICGLAGGALFYTYPYYWTAAAAIGGLVFLGAAVRGDRELVVRFAQAALAALLVGSVFWGRFFALYGTPTWRFNALKAGWGHAARAEWWFLGVSVLVAAWVARARVADWPARAVAVGGLLAGALLLVLPATGLALMQPDHWRLQFFKFFVLACALAALYATGVHRVAAGRPRAWCAACVALLLLAAGLGAHRQALFARRQGAAYTLAPHKGVLAFLESRPRGSVVLTDTDALNLLIAPYTHAHVFCHVTLTAWTGPQEALARHRAARALLGPGRADYLTLDLSKGADSPALRRAFARRADPLPVEGVKAILSCYRLDVLALRAEAEPTMLAHKLFPREVYRDAHYAVYARR